MALGGRRFIKKNNNQMKDSVDMKGCVGEEARPGRNVWGGQLPVIWGGILIDEKNREMRGTTAQLYCTLSIYVTPKTISCCNQKTYTTT